MFPTVYRPRVNTHAHTERQTDRQTDRETERCKTEAVLPSQKTAALVGRRGQ